VSEAVPGIVRRLMLAVDASQCAAVDVRAVIELAALMGAELQGLFVEDSDLLGLAQLPFAREFGRSSGLDRPIVRESVESLLRRRIQNVIGELERAGKLRNVPVSHRTARGKVVHQALEQGARGDIVILRPPGVARPTASPHAVQRRPGPVMVWYEDGPAGAVSCDIAAYVARQLGVGLLVGFSTARFSSADDVRKQIAGLLTQASSPVSILGITGAQVGEVIEAARTARAVQLVLAGSGSLATSEMLERILAELAVGLVLVR
jgi:hypothetical protein